MSRAFHIPGVIFLFIAFVLLLLVSISLPFLTGLDFARIHFNQGISSSVSQIRFGSWAYCSYTFDGDRTCSPAHSAYSLTFNSTINHSQTNIVVVAGSSWTRGLAVHPVAAAVTFVAFLLSLSNHVTFTLLSSLVSFLAALLTLIAFAIDIALFARIKHQAHLLAPIPTTTDTAPGCTVCFGRRRSRMTGNSDYPLETKSSSWGNRFRFRSRT
ncbi:hypothetical protein EIP91_012429 [Steccherinum ochraceum]|uniref:Pali-domain-containing protein n=1 Tax=Steccherinum ochraceum TaxID=92696 RepID=A0A4R0RWV7_9APHY|nr:hypothetical protein EIP91_012429 [Steccherinum ochraceum]